MKNSSFEQLLTDSMPLLKAYAWKLTLNKLKADELTQDTLCKALYKKHLYRNEQNFKGWVFTVMRNIFINNYNKERKRKTVVFEDANITSGYTGCDEVAHYMELKYVKQVMQKLPIGMKKSIQLYSMGYQYNEIAVMLNEPIGTIKSRIYLARKNMMHVKKRVV